MSSAVLNRTFLFIFRAIAGILLIGWIVMLLWNSVASPVLHISAISFRQALGILLLCKILFGSVSGRSYSYRKQRMMWKLMTPE